jgi:hypothetical protein
VAVAAVGARAGVHGLRDCCAAWLRWGSPQGPPPMQRHTVHAACIAQACTSPQTATDLASQSVSQSQPQPTLPMQPHMHATTTNLRAQHLASPPLARAPPQASQRPCPPRRLAGRLCPLRRVPCAAVGGTWAAATRAHRHSGDAPALGEWQGARLVRRSTVLRQPAICARQCTSRSPGTQLAMQFMQQQQREAGRGQVS